jgi:hypothetical protein
VCKYLTRVIDSIIQVRPLPDSSESCSKQPRDPHAIGGLEFLGQKKIDMCFFLEKCLVVHSHSTPIPPLSTWTNNVRDNRESVVGPYFFNNIIGPRRQW